LTPWKGRRGTAVSLVIAIVVGGCSHGHSHGGKLVAEYPRGRTPIFGWTENRAEYVLFARQRPPGLSDGEKAGNGWRLESWRLKKRSPLGFKTVDGQLIAVAGRDEMILPPGSYCFHVRRGSTPTDWVATTVAVVALVGVGVGAYAIYWSNEFWSGWGESR
jgi:hypothetical protein